MRLSVIRQEQRQCQSARQGTGLQWRRHGEFGMFIHCGLYAPAAGFLRGGEVASLGKWIVHNALIAVIESEQLVARFRPSEYDAAQWVALACQASQECLAITAKHYDSFCIHHAWVSPHNIVDATSFRRDRLKELADECQLQSIRFGLYYSQTQDWRHPDGDSNDWDYDEGSKDCDGYIERYAKPQRRELLTGYGPTSVVWFDTPRRSSERQSRELWDLAHERQPDCLANGRRATPWATAARPATTASAPNWRTLTGRRWP